jgi:hypothetical protein
VQGISARLSQTLTQGKLGDLERGLVLPLCGADPTPHSLRRAERALVREVRFHVYALGKFGPPWPYRFSKAETAAEARSVARALVAERQGRAEDARG